MYIRIYTYTHVYIYIYIYIYTHTHIDRYNLCTTNRESRIHTPRKVAYMHFVKTNEMQRDSKCIDGLLGWVSDIP